MIRALLAALCLLSAGAAVAAESVDGVRLWAGPDHTRVVMDLSAPVDHRIFALHEPERLVVDLTAATLRATGFPAGAGAVRRIRSGDRDGTLRVVLDLDGSDVRPRSVILPPNDVYGYRLVIDLLRQGGVQTQPAAVVEKTGRDVLIAVDPGHGGEDPGAVGISGTHEKRVVLEIARRLVRLIDAQPGMRAMLTRDGDYFMSHRARMKRARTARADLFISIHADAFKDKRAYGSSVYALSQGGATSEAARWLAERENAADLIGGVSLDDKDDLLASVLLDLSQTAAISASLSAGTSVLEELAKINRIRRREVQQASFLVLKAPDIPSILVETAFISNPNEERRLRDPDYQEKFARALMTGIRAYFDDYAPPDTLLAEIKAGTTGPSLR